MSKLPVASLGNTLSVLCLTVLLASCGSESTGVSETPSNVAVAMAPGPGAESTEKRPPNILVIIGDDMGSETLSCTGIGPAPATTPILDQLCHDGMKFTNFWSQPACTPTRTAMMTGRYAIRTGVGRPTGDAGESRGPWPELPPKPANASAEPTGGGGMGMGMGGGMGPGGAASWGPMTTEYMIPMAFRDNPALGYATAAIGKWHLADKNNGWWTHPNDVGFDHFAGDIRGFPDTYFSTNYVVNGEVSGKSGYLVPQKVDDAIAWLDQQGNNPWFMWFAFNLPHTPLHLPPEEFWTTDHSQLDPQENPQENAREVFLAMMEAMDTEIGRLLASMDQETRDNTFILFIGDNGTSRGVLTEPYLATGGKGSVYQGGINTPMIVTGPGVPAGTSTDALVNTTDFFYSVMELAGIDPAATVPVDIVTDSISFVPYLTNPGLQSIRTLIYADTFSANFSGIEDADFAMRDLEYKIIRNNGEYEFYNLVDDPYENSDLLKGEMTADDQARYDDLLAAVTALRDTRSHAPEQIAGVTE